MRYTRLYLFLSLCLTWLAHSAQTQTCNFSVETENTSGVCAPSANGRATIFNNGVPLVLGGGGCITSPTSPESCITMEAGSIELTQTSGELFMSGGQTYYLTSNFDGPIKFGTGGAKLIICSDVKITTVDRNENGANVEIIVNGSLEAEMPNLNLNPNYSISNYGTLTTNAAGFDGGFFNHGTFICGDNFNLNSSSSSFDNTGTITISGSLLINMPIFKNRGVLNIGGDFFNNGSGKIENHCTIDVTGGFSHNSLTENFGLISVANAEVTINSNIYKGYSGSKIVAGSLMLNGEMTGIGMDCSTIEVIGETRINGSGKLSGNLGVCFGTGPFTNNGMIEPSVTTDCSCPATGVVGQGVTGGTVTWSTGATGVTSLSSLSAGTYTVTVNIPGCEEEVLTFTIEQPEELLATINLTSDTIAQVFVTDPDVSCTYTYEWTDGYSSVNSTRDLSNVVAGTYCVKVIGCDRETCEELCVTVGSGDPVNPDSTTKICVVYSETGDTIKVISKNPNLVVLTTTGTTDSLCITTLGACDSNIVILNTTNGITTELTIENPRCPGKTGITIDSVSTIKNSYNCDYQVAVDLNGGSGQYTLLLRQGNNVTTHQAGEGIFTFYEVEQGRHPLKVIDRVSLRDTTIFINVPERTQEQFELVETAGGLDLYCTGCQGSYMVNAPFAPFYNVVEVTTEAYTLVNSYQYSPYPTQENEYLIRVTNECNVDTTLTQIVPDKECLTETPTYTLEKDAPSNKGLSDGFVEVQSLTAGYETYWRKASSDNYMQLDKYGNIPAGTYLFKIVNETSDCVADTGRLVLEDGPETIITDSILIDKDPNDPDTVIIKLELSDPSDSIKVGDKICYAINVLDPVSGSMFDTTIFALVIDLTKVESTLEIVFPIDFPIYSSVIIEITPFCNDSIEVITTTITKQVITTCPYTDLFSFASPSCAGFENGSIEVTTPQEAKNFVWQDLSVQDPNKFNTARESLGAGSYSFSYSLGTCGTKGGTITLNEPAKLVPTIVPDEANRTVAVVVTGGSAPYSYQWEDEETPRTENTREELVPGTLYTITVTDDNGCTEDVSFEFDACGVSTITATVVYNTATESAVISASGGSGSYSYAWFTGSRQFFGQTLSEAELTDQATYNVVVTDDNGCEGETSYKHPCNVTTNFDVVIDKDATTIAVCDGEASITLEGGEDVANYVIIWDERNVIDLIADQGLEALQLQSAVSLQNACAGNHTVFVYNSLTGCGVDQPFTVDGKKVVDPVCELSATLSESELEKTCFNDRLDDVRVNVTKGTKNYVYNWTYTSVDNVTNTFQGFQPALSNPQVGIYSLIVEDAEGCKSPIVSLTVTGESSPLAITDTITAEPSCENGQGEVEVFYSGGDEHTTYSITWSDDASITDFVRALNPLETYNYTVSNGACSKVGNVRIGEGFVFNKSLDDTEKLCPDNIIQLFVKDAEGYDQVWSKLESTTYAELAEPARTAGFLEVSEPGMYKLTRNKTGCPTIEEIIDVVADDCKNVIPRECEKISYTIPALEETEEDICKQQQELYAFNVAGHTYTDYFREKKTEFKTTYEREAMTHVDESLRMSYEDLEHHYTLYYYDQAGNLVSTVPPAGVRTLSETEVDAIDVARLSENQNVELAHTNHTLSTTYKYNSLNQLVAQNVPDNDAQSIWDASESDQVGANQSVAVMDADGNMVWLFANDAENAFFYQSTDGGSQYEEKFTLDLGDIRDITSLGTNDQIVYAVGTKGLLMQSDNGGQTWELLPWADQSEELVNIQPRNQLETFVMTSTGIFYKQSNPGGMWNPQSISLTDQNVNQGSLVNFLQGKTLTDVSYDEQQLYITLHNATDSWIFAGVYVNGNITLQRINLLLDNQQKLIHYDNANYQVLNKTTNEVLELSNGKLFSKQILTGITNGVKEYQSTQERAVVINNSNAIFTSTDGTTFTERLNDNVAYKIVKSGDDLAIVPKNNGTKVYEVRSIGTLNEITPPANQKNVKAYTKKGNIHYVYYENGEIGKIIGGLQLIIPANNVVYTNASVLERLNNVLYVVNNDAIYSILESNPTQRNVLSGGWKDLKIFDGQLYGINQSGVFSITTNTTTGVMTAANTALITLPNGDLANLTGLLAFGDNETSYAYLGDQNNMYAGSNKVIEQNGSGTTTITKVETEQLNATEPKQNTNYSVGDNGSIYSFQDYSQQMARVVLSNGFSEDLLQATTTGNNQLRVAAATQAYDLQNGALNGLGVWNQVLDISEDRTLVESNNSITLLGSQGIELSGLDATITILNSRNNTAQAGGEVAELFYKSTSINWAKVPTIRTAPITAADLQGNYLVAVGQDGVILTSQDKGDKFNPVANDNTLDLTAVAVTSQNNFVVGRQDGAILNYSSGTPTLTTINGGATPTARINKIIYTYLGKVWAIRGRDLLLRTNTNTFGLVFTAPEVLNDIVFGDNFYGYIVGEQGTAYRIKPVGEQEEGNPIPDAADVITASIAPEFEFIKIATDNNLGDDQGTELPTIDLESVDYTDRLTGYLTTDRQIHKTIDGGYHWQLENTQTETVNITTTTDGNLAYANGQNLGTIVDESQEFTSRFWYDELGRLILSQNARQYNIAEYIDEHQYQVPNIPRLSVDNPEELRGYSYTLYDDIGRITEVGELLTRQELITNKYESQVAYEYHRDNFTASGTKVQISRTYYDKAAFPELVTEQNFRQKHLRPRVSSVTYQQYDRTDYDRATHYTYDIHGNVNSLLQEIKRVEENNLGFVGRVSKRIDYEYDLISGNVNFVHFQKGEEDAFTHKYTYDGDNRISEVFTSTDEVIWTKEANYDYYAHGPLARAITGNDTIDQCDYAYTIHGWIKGVKSQNFAYSLGYYNDTDEGHTDYKSISGQSLAELELRETPLETNLFNGNISTMSTHTPAFGKGPEPMTESFIKQFEYDQLNRIKAGVVSNGTNTDAFRTSYSYDANGNIDTLRRSNGSGVMFDEMAYHYHNVDQGYLRNTNRLRWVDDNTLTESIHPNDIEDQDRDNYNYDQLGNLLADEAESIKKIEWTAAGKVHAVLRANGSPLPNLFFSYDAMGNRIAKKSIDPVTRDVKTTYYFREASGNTMAVYQKTNTTRFRAIEYHIYGSSRLGQYNPITEQSITQLSARVNQSNNYIGNRVYEAKDHLGNVHLVLTDRKESAIFSDNVQAAYEYYPFGMAMQTKEFNNAYRYGFNGMEKDNDWNGSGNSYDFGARIYDARLGRWLAVDPLDKDYPAFSDYTYVANNPIYYIDSDGKKIWTYLKDLLERKQYQTLFNGINNTFIWAQVWNNLNESDDVHIRISMGVLQKGGQASYFMNSGTSEDPHTVTLTKYATKNSLGEEVFHAGQQQFYGFSSQKDMLEHIVSVEVEAKVVSAYEFYKKYGEKSLKNYDPSKFSGTGTDVYLLYKFDENGQWKDGKITVNDDVIDYFKESETGEVSEITKKKYEAYLKTFAKNLKKQSPAYNKQFTEVQINAYDGKTKFFDSLLKKNRAKKKKK